MLWKTSKDRLIEFLQAELAEEKNRCDAVRAMWQTYENATKGFIEEQQQIAREAVALASMAVSQLPEAKQNAEIHKDQPYKPRTMSAWCTSLSERSYKRAQAKGKNLVADMPPPGAQKPNGAS